MITEEIKEKIVNVFGHYSDDFGCENADEAMDYYFEEAHNNEPMTLLIDFLVSCTEVDFKEIRELLKQSGMGIKHSIKGF